MFHVTISATPVLLRPVARGAIQPKIDCGFWLVRRVAVLGAQFQVASLENDEQTKRPQAGTVVPPL
jgi:hypothetical protein